jgi:hypothetical protein
VSHTGYSKLRRTRSGRLPVARSPRASKLARAVAAVSLALAALTCGTLSARAQQATPQPPALPAAAVPAAPAAPAIRTPANPPPRTSGPIVDESFSIRQDEDLYQLEEAVTLIAGSLNRISDKVSALAINSFNFGGSDDKEFRIKAEVIILEKLLNANANVKLVQCQECQKLDTKIVNGVLHLKKGIPSQEARLELAKKLGVDGFIDIGVFRDNRQLTVYIKVVEAETGAVILVDEMVGRQAPRRDAVTLSFGQISFPIVFKLPNKVYTSNALAFTATEQVQLTGRWSFGVDVSIYTDNDTTNTNPHLTLSGGVLLAPFLGFDVLQIPQSTSRVVVFAGVGELLDPQLNYGVVYRAGVQGIVGDRLVISFGLNSFESTNVQLTNGDKNAKVNSGLLTDGAKLGGESYELRFGYRF